MVANDLRWAETTFGVSFEVFRAVDLLEGLVWRFDCTNYDKLFKLTNQLVES